MIKPFFLIKEKETDECDEDTEFTVPLITAIFGRYDNELKLKKKEIEIKTGKKIKSLNNYLNS